MRMKKDVLQKKYLWLLAAGLLATGLSACSNEDEEGGAGGYGKMASGMPLVANAGIEFPVTTVYHGSNSSSRSLAAAFSYRDGRMTSGLESYDYAPYIFYSGPLTVRMERETSYGTETEEYKNIRVNSAGFITSCDIIYTETDDEETFTETYNVTVAYDGDGHEIFEKYKYTDSDGEGGQGSTTYTWEDGNLVNLSNTETWNYDGEEETWRYEEEYTYDDDEDVNPNPGVWHFYDHQSVGVGGCFPESFLYAGLLGRPTKNIPIAYKESQYDDGQYYAFTTMGVGYNSDNSVREIRSYYYYSNTPITDDSHFSTTSYSTISYDYETEWEDDYETLIPSYYAAKRSSVDAGKPERKMSIMRKRIMERNRQRNNLD